MFNSKHVCIRCQCTAISTTCASGDQRYQTAITPTPDAIKWSFVHDRFELDKFYPEAKRILKPAGALAIWGYDVPQFEAPDANKLLNELYSKSLGSYWDAKRQHIDNHLRGQPAYMHTAVFERVHAVQHSAIFLLSLFQ